MKPGGKSLVVIMGIITAFVFIAIFGMGDGVKSVSKMRYGIDIRGGVEAIFEPQDLDRQATEKELETARNVIEMRLDAQNISDREVTVDKKGGYVIVRFPWKSDETDFNPEEAISELGDMAKLTFRDPDGKVLLEGKNVKSSSVERDQTVINGEYVVKLNFDSYGASQFEKITGELVGKNIGIYMDEQQISNPLVESKISGGDAVINGMANFDEAKELSDKINAGALPFSLATTSFSTISPSLGNNALNIMILAGVVAFAIICIFMITYYKLQGVVACITLVLQMALQLLSVSVPQFTLTLPGIAGIILSLGMAVDANIIISERVSEEIKKGYFITSAVKKGYKNAFSSVLDGNVTTAIVAIILMIFGSGSMLSFGYTLLMGMIINVFIGVTVSKNLQLSLATFKVWDNVKWFRKKKDVKVINFFKNKIIFAFISGAVIIAGVIGCFVNGVSLDTQFTGGVVINYKVEEEIDCSKIQDAVEEITSRAVTVQESKSNVDESMSVEVTLAGTGGISPEEQKNITKAVQSVADGKSVELKETFAVEPYIGKTALNNAIIAIVVSSIFIVIYVWIRFSTMSGLAAGITSLIALVHDVLLVFFAFVLFKIPLNDAFVAVVLTIIGYSINDTIVVYDRIRENKKDNPRADIVELNNISLSQVLSRSINASLTTAVCVLTILIVSVVFQIDSIYEFSLPMFFGLISGCYSSMCIASILWVMWKKREQNKVATNERKKG